MKNVNQMCMFVYYTEQHFIPELLLCAAILVLNHKILAEGYTKTYIVVRHCYQYCFLQSFCVYINTLQLKKVKVSCQELPLRRRTLRANFDNIRDDAINARKWQVNNLLNVFVRGSSHFTATESVAVFVPSFVFLKPIKQLRGLLFSILTAMANTHRPPERVAEIFTNDWEEVSTRPEGEQHPCWNTSFDFYRKLPVEITNVDAADLTHNDYIR